MTLEQIQNLSLSNTGTLLQVLGAMGIVPVLDSPLAGDWYARFSADQKSTQAEIEAALEVYKQGLTDTENARLAEVARVQDINTRWEAIGDVYAAVANSGNVSTNPAIELVRIISENDQAALSAIEQAWQVFKDEKEKYDAILVDIKSGNNDKQCCEDVLSYIGGINRRRSYTAEQIAIMTSAFGTIQGLLIGRRPSSALKLVNLITPDGVIVTDETKTGAQAIFAKYQVSPAP